MTTCYKYYFKFLRSETDISQGYEQTSLSTYLIKTVFLSMACEDDEDWSRQKISDWAIAILKEVDWKGSKGALCTSIIKEDAIDSVSYNPGFLEARRMLFYMKELTKQKQEGRKWNLIIKTALLFVTLIGCYFVWNDHEYKTCSQICLRRSRNARFLFPHLIMAVIIAVGLIWDLYFMYIHVLNATQIPRYIPKMAVHVRFLVFPLCVCTLPLLILTVIVMCSSYICQVFAANDYILSFHCTSVITFKAMYYFNIYFIIYMWIEGFYLYFYPLKRKRYYGYQN